MDTLLSPIVISLILLFFVGEKIAIDYKAMMTGLVKMIVLPSLLGLSIHDLSRGNFHDRCAHYLGPLSSFCLCAVIAVNVGTAQATAAKLASEMPSLVMTTMLLVLSGFISGFLLSHLFGFNYQITTSCIFCAGIRNTSAGLVIALAHLPVQASIPILVAMFFQQPAAALVQKIRFRHQLSE
jgi:predicted Na+-dependent transporter